MLINPELLSEQVEIKDPLIDGAMRMVKRGSERVIEAVYVKGKLVVRRGEIAALFRGCFSWRVRGGCLPRVCEELVLRKRFASGDERLKYERLKGERLKYERLKGELATSFQN